MSLSTETGAVSGQPINDCYMSQTATAGTAMTRIIPPRSDGRACAGSIGYDCGGTAHAMTFMNVMAELRTTSDAAAGQAVVPFNTINTAADGSALANTDYFSIQHEDGSWGAYKFSSVSGLNVTMATNLTKKVLSGARVCFHGTPGASGDWPERVLTLKASAVTSFIASDYRIRACSAAMMNQPILVHVDNVTAAGVWQYLSIYYDGF